MTLHASIGPELHREVLDRVRRGEPRKAVAIDLDLSERAVAKYTAHLPNGTRRDLVRARILVRLAWGDSLDAIASLEGCMLSFVACVVRAWVLEQRLNERPAAACGPACSIPTAHQA